MPFLRWEFQNKKKESMPREKRKKEEKMEKMERSRYIYEKSVVILSDTLKKTKKKQEAMLVKAKARKIY